MEILSFFKYFIRIIFYIPFSRYTPKTLTTNMDDNTGNTYQNLKTFIIFLKFLYTAGLLYHELFYFCVNYFNMLCERELILQPRYAPHGRI